MNNKTPDFNEIAKIEKAIKEKYGQEAIENPKKHWDQEKEKKYLKDLKKFYKEKQRNSEIKETEHFIIKDKTLEKKQENTCPVCKKYSLFKKDDLYMLKFECCFDCYIDYVEGRESRWNSGWRPKE